MSAVRIETASNGIARLILDVPGGKVNILSGAVLQEIAAALDDARNRSDVKALMIVSGKPGTFIAGADVGEIHAIATEEEGKAKAAEGQMILHKFAELPKPTLAAIDGVCLGGGLELALACTFRIATDEARTKLGLPEVRLGIIPGFGGTQRLPRRVGLPAALDLILTGRSVSGSAAYRMGLVDAVVPAPYLRAQAEAWLLHAIEHPPKHGRFPRLAPRRKRPAGARFLNSLPGRWIAFRSARRRLDKTLNGVYPAPYMALKAIRTAYRKPFLTGLGVEASLVGPLIVSPTSKSLTWLFGANNDARREGQVTDPSTGKPAAPRRVERAAVLGAGVMGGGIAHLLASEGIPVRMKDVAADQLLKGLQAAAKLNDGQVKRRRMTRNEAARRIRRIAPTLTYDGLANTDVVIEAVVENLGVKQDVLADVEARVPEHCVFATNTSSLPIQGIAERARHPERVVGLHFFNPVHRMPLVEVIAGPQSSPEAVATVHALARRLGKTPILVKDEPGFLVNRVLTAYLAEALKMLAEGNDPVFVDRAMEHFGMPMGPFALFDQIGFDTASKASKAIEAINEKYLPKVSVMSLLVESGRLGVKNGRGFYHYKRGKRKGFDRSVLGLVDRHGHGVKDMETVQSRLYLPMINEAVRCLNAGVARSPADVDLGMVMGTGFPPFRGGPLRNADIAGISAVVEKMNALAEKHGDRLAPEPSLVEMALSGRRFYPE